MSTARPPALSDLSSDELRAELDALRARIIDDPDVPEAVRGFLAKGADLESIRLDEHGRWWHDGALIDHPRLTSLFSRSVVHTTAGNWVLSVPPYTYPIVVERTGWFATGIDAVEGDETTLRLSDGRSVTLSWEGLCTDGDDFIALQLDDGQWARLTGGAYQYVLSLIDADDDGWVVDLGDRRVRLGVCGT